MKTLTIWFIDEATMCCWLMKTTFKLIYGLPMKNKHLFLFQLFLLLTVPIFWHFRLFFFLFCFIFIFNIFFFITAYLEKTISILLIMYLLPKAIALQLQLPSPNNFIIKIELFYIYFSRILATGAEQLFSWTPPSCWTPLVVKIIKIHVKKFIVNKASDLHPTALIKIELFHRYFSRVLATGVKKLFCWTSPSGYLRKS